MAPKKSEADKRLDAHYEQINNLGDQVARLSEIVDRLEQQIAAVKAQVSGALGLPQA